MKIPKISKRTVILISMLFIFFIAFLIPPLIISFSSDVAGKGDQQAMSNLLQMSTMTVRNMSVLLKFIAWMTALFAILIAVLGGLGLKEYFDSRVARKAITDEFEKLKKEHVEHTKQIQGFQAQMKKDQEIRFNLTTAKIFFTQEQYEESWEHLISLPDEYSYEVPLYRGLTLLKRKDYSDAITEFEKALKFPDVDKARVHFNIAVCFFQNGVFDKAISECDLAINLRRNYWRAYNIKALCLRRIGKIDEALKVLDQIIDKKFDVAFYNKACYYSLLGKKAQAIDNLKRAIELNTKNKDDALKDPDFSNIAKTPEFEKLTKGKTESGV